MDQKNQNNKIKNDGEDFGKVVDALHKKQKLPPLRTYQGDMAEFIKEKNESVISVNIKEKVREEEKAKILKREQVIIVPKEIPKAEKEVVKEFENEAEKVEESGEIEKLEEVKTESNKIEIPTPPKIIKVPKELSYEITEEKIRPKSRSFGTGIIITAISLLLVVSGAYALLRAFNIMRAERPVDTTEQIEIIPFTNAVTVSNVSKENFKTQIDEVALQNGINILRLHKADGSRIATANNFFNFIGIELPSGLRRDLLPDFAFGKMKDNSLYSTFVVIKIKDFGRAFASLLEWERSMIQDLDFMQTESDIVIQDLLWIS